MYTVYFLESPSPREGGGISDTFYPKMQWFSPIQRKIKCAGKYTPLSQKLECSKRNEKLIPISNTWIVYLSRRGLGGKKRGSRNFYPGIQTIQTISVVSFQSIKGTISVILNVLSYKNLQRYLCPPRNLIYQKHTESLALWTSLKPNLSKMWRLTSFFWLEKCLFLRIFTLVLVGKKCAWHFGRDTTNEKIKKWKT